MKERWEIINGGVGSSDECGPWIMRYPVPGGWLYRVDNSTADTDDTQLVFVPNPRK